MAVGLPTAIFSPKSRKAAHSNCYICFSFFFSGSKTRHSLSATSPKMRRLTPQKDKKKILRGGMQRPSPTCVRPAFLLVGRPPLTCNWNAGPMPTRVPPATTTLIQISSPTDLFLFPWNYYYIFYSTGYLNEANQLAWMFHTTTICMTQAIRFN